MSTTMDKVKELGITKGEATAVADSAMIGRFSVWVGDRPTAVTTIRSDIPEAQADANARLYADAHNTAQKSGCLPSELLEQRDEAIRLLERFVSEADFKERIAGDLGHLEGVTLESRSFLTRIKQGQP